MAALFTLTVLTVLLLSSCEVVGPLVGAGVGTAVRKDQDSEVSETFTHPLQRTKAAALTALKRMQIEVQSSEGERITGKTREHFVELRLAEVTEKTTKMTVRIGEGLKHDRATAQEIVAQTKRALGAASG